MKLFFSLLLVTVVGASPNWMTSLEAARQQAQKFDPERLAREYIDLFHRVLGSQPAKTPEEVLIPGGGFK